MMFPLYTDLNTNAFRILKLTANSKLCDILIAKTSFLWLTNDHIFLEIFIFCLNGVDD